MCVDILFLYDSLRAWFFLHFTRCFSAFTCFLRGFSLGVHHATYLVFGTNVGKLVRHIFSRLPHIVVMAVSSSSFVCGLFLWSSHFRR